MCYLRSPCAVYMAVETTGSAIIWTSQYLWEYGPGKFAMGPPVILSLQLDGATGYFDGWLYGATAYLAVKIQRGQRLFWSTPIRGHGLY